MLLELSIRQFAIIQDLKVQFNTGLNILTGETGAGKSIIIDAIQLITGGRGSVDFIRSNSEKAEIEALFDLSADHQSFKRMQELGLDVTEDSMLILKRELLNNGKSICRINGQLVTLSTLKEIGEYLLQLHSQNQHQNLLSQDKQLNLLDSYGHKEIQDIKQQFFELYNEYIQLKKEARKLSDNEKEISQKIDLYQYQINEINNAELTSGEDESLNERRNAIKHFEKITKGLTSTQSVLYGEKGVVDKLGYVINVLGELAHLDKEIEDLNEQIVSAFYQIEDATIRLNDKINNLEYDPNQVDFIEERLSLIFNLKRKYGDSVDAILEYAVTIEDELNTLVNREEKLRDIQGKLAIKEKEIFESAVKLSKVRSKIAQSLAKNIEDELTYLQMPNAKFEIEITSTNDPNEFNYTGADKINFLISPNPGEPLKPLARIASGGELSRIMLAIQTILAKEDDAQTLIFDEIDTGVSGRAAQSIAEKLAFVARDKQVFVVTHLPQVASMADSHYLIKKIVKNNTTYTEIEHLNEENRIDELARMLGGVEITDLTKKHAKEMIEKTRSFKN